MRSLDLPTTGLYAEADNPLSGLMEGWKHQIRPHQTLAVESPDDPSQSILQKIGNTALDVVADPLLAAGPAVKASKVAELGKVGGILGNAAEGASSAGKYAEGLGKGELLSQAAGRALRRTISGTLATGDPLTGAGLGQLLGLGENQLAKLLPGLASKAVMQQTDGIPGGIADDIGSAVELAPSYNVPRPNSTRMADAASRFGAEVPGSGEVITPDAIFQQLGSGRASMSLPAGGQAMGELPGPSVFPMGRGPIPMGTSEQLAPEDMIARLVGPGNRMSGDALTQIFRMLLEQG